MLKKETVRANAILASLTDEQVTAIETLSQNDENAVLSARIGEIYGGIDRDLLEVSGIGKNGTEKTYDYVKRVAGELKTKAGSIDGLNTQIQTLTAEKARLEKAIADGATDREASRQFNAVKAELETTKAQYIELKGKHDAAEAGYAQKLHGYRVANEIGGASAGLKFKREFPEAVTKQLLANAINTLKTGYRHEFIDDGQGGERMIFLDMEKGARLNNPENRLNPFTAAEMLRRELKTVGILDEGRQQSGGGTTPPTGGGSGGTLDLSAAKTRIEAQNMAAQSLMQQGMMRGSKEYQDAMDKAWADYKVQDLPE